METEFEDDLGIEPEVTSKNVDSSKFSDKHLSKREIDDDDKSSASKKKKTGPEKKKLEDLKGHASEFNRSVIGKNFKSIDKKSEQASLQSGLINKNLYEDKPLFIVFTDGKLNESMF
jgi:hypothetical protein